MRSACIPDMKKVKLVIFDVDGTLTDGKIYIGENGEIFKAFSVRDGMGINLARKVGLKTAIISGRTSPIVEKRAAELKIDAVWQGVDDKRIAYAELKKKFSLKDDEIAFIGDDINDLPILTKVGLPCAVGDAVQEVKDVAKLVSVHNGGDGAVREILENIIMWQGKSDEVMSAYIS